MNEFWHVEEHLTGWAVVAGDILVIPVSDEQTAHGIAAWRNFALNYALDHLERAA